MKPPRPADREGIDMAESTSTYSGDFGELVIETEMIEVTSSLPRPDKNWTYTDRQGHEHRYDEDFRPPSSSVIQPPGHEVACYPTLIEVVDRTYWCAECNDEHEETHLECRLCGEHITPGTVGPSPYREFAPGRTAAYLNGEPISRERAEEIVREFRARRP